MASPRADLVISVMLYMPIVFHQAFNREEEMANAQVQPAKYLCAFLVIETIQKETVPHHTLGIACENGITLYLQYPFILIKDDNVFLSMPERG